MKVLIGTTNPSKIQYFKDQLQGYGLEFYTLRDLGISAEPDETGRNPEENARIKAAFYGQFFDPVICNDSGLYFDALSISDPLQPGLHVRTPQGVRLSDDEMVAFYTHLVRRLGGKARAHYLSGFAVFKNGKMKSMMEDPALKQSGAFEMLDHEVAKRHPGWPLDSISRWNPEEEDDSYQSIRAFLLQALEIE